jgi:hypothetical protein
MLQVGEHLEGEWTLDELCAESYWQTTIKGPGGLSLFVDFSKRGRLFISGCGWPKDNTGHEHYPRHGRNLKISVRGDRGAEAIAKEITRRLMPDYLNEHAKQKELAAEYDEVAKKKERITDAVHVLIGGTSRTRNGQTVFDIDGYGKQITVTSGGHVSIEFKYLESGEALKLIRAMKRHLTGVKQ